MAGAPLFSTSSSSSFLFLSILTIIIDTGTTSVINLDDKSANNLDDSHPIIKPLQCQAPFPPKSKPVFKQDIMLLHFAMNLEYTEAEFFLHGAFGHGLDELAPQLVALGGPPPYGARKANLDNLTWNMISEMGLEEIGHLRVIYETFGGIPRPLLNLSAENFAYFMNEAFGYELNPPFDPYRDSISYMLATYVVPYMGLTGYVGAISLLKGHVSKRVTAGLLGVESGQDAMTRQYLYERAHHVVHPYKYTVAEFTNKISILRNRLGMCGIKDEGVIVPLKLGPEGRTTTNVLSSNHDEISYARTPQEILRVLYSTGKEHIPGGFWPCGANGEIARRYLEEDVDHQKDSAHGDQKAYSADDGN